ncbi:MAG: flagellar protein export ATPase FliI [Thermotogae bacterium]|nr:flagellar protein export ATPase FliI [Thermotogota bacterium]
MTSKLQSYLKSCVDKIDNVQPIRVNGRVNQVVGLTIESEGPEVFINEVCKVKPKNSNKNIISEVVGFRDTRVVLMPLDDMSGIGPEAEVLRSGKYLQVRVGEELRGRVLNGLGNPLDDKPPISSKLKYPVYNSPPNPLKRKRIKEPVYVGVRAMDGFLTLGKGQRIGIFSGSGVGKSTLLGMIARNTTANINVIALIGERGREVRDFIERDLGEEGLKRSVVVVATSDQPALVRLKGAFVATTIAEYFRDLGYDVMLMMDSITRFAMAQREVGLAVGEPPATRGYTPSVYALLPKLLERAGTSEKGSITGIYTTLVEADDMNEPISDAVRAILDGHIVLSRQLASNNHYPPIDVLQSVSRVMPDVTEQNHRDIAKRLLDLISTYNNAKDLIDIGAYVDGSDPKIDEAKSKIDDINAFLQQDVWEKSSFEETISRMEEITNK